MVNPVNQKPTIKIMTISSEDDGNVFVQAEIQSRTNPNEFHITKVKIDGENGETSYAYCNCKGFEYRKRCHHVEALKEFMINNYKDKLAEAIEKKKRLAREALEW